MLFVVRGITLVLGDRKFWPFIWRPMLSSAGIFAAVLALGYWLIVPQIKGLFNRIGLEEGIASAGATAAYVAVLWFVAGILFITIAGLTSSFLWDRLSYEVERTLRPAPPKQDLTWKLWVADALPRTAFATLIFCGSVGCFWLLPVGVVLASWLCLYDYTASAYMRRGVLFMGQLSKAPRNNGWPTFALTCGLLTLIPFVNVVLLPGLVAGGTLMVAENEQRLQPQ